MAAHARRIDTASDAGRLIVVGEGSIADGIRSALEEIDAEIVERRSPDALDDVAIREALAFVWSCADRERGFGREIARMKALAPIPIYAVVRDDAPGKLARGLYRAGAAGVFAWPREGLLLARYVAEMLSLRIVRGPVRNADAALARTVRAHLRFIPMSGLPLTVETEQGRVFLGGSLDSLAERDEIERRIAMIAGVTHVDVGSLKVVPKPVADREIRAACRRLVRLEQAAGDASGTISVAVENGTVRYSGTVGSGAVAQRLRERTAQVRGVRSIELDLETSVSGTRRAQSAQRRLEGLVRALHADQPVEVIFHGGIAILEGRVDTLHAKRSIEALVSQDPMVSRVVNKLTVSAGPSR